MFLREGEPCSHLARNYQEEPRPGPLGRLPQPAQPPVGEGGKVGVRPKLRGGCSWVDDVCTPRPRVKALSGRMEKAGAPLSAAFVTQNFPRPWPAVGVRSTSQLRAAHPAQRPEGGEGCPPAPWLSAGPGDGWQPSETRGGPGSLPLKRHGAQKPPAGPATPTHPKGSDPGGQGRGPRLQV